jgi:uncharacterized protein YdhG (YjbR/CyaY superfamily)
LVGVRSDAATVDDYIAAAPEERRDALRLLRRLCREELTGFEEAMRYGMPGYLRDGRVEVGFASQKHYLALYILREAVMQAHARRLAGLSHGKSCIRFRRAEQLDPETVRSLLGAVVTDAGPRC